MAVGPVFSLQFFLIHSDSFYVKKLFPASNTKYSIRFNGHLKKKGISGQIRVNYEEQTLSVEVN